MNFKHAVSQRILDFHLKCIFLVYANEHFLSNLVIFLLIRYFCKWFKRGRGKKITPKPPSFLNLARAILLLYSYGTGGSIRLCFSKVSLMLLYCNPSEPIWRQKKQQESYREAIFCRKEVL